MKTKRFVVPLIAILLVAMTACYVCATDDVFAVTVVLKVENGNFSFTRNVSALTFDQTTQGADMGIASASTSTNDLPINNVTTPYYCFFRNLSTNVDSYVTLTLHLRPGDVALLPAASTNMTYYTTNSTANTEYWINQE